MREKENGFQQFNLFLWRLKKKVLPSNQLNLGCF